MARIKLCRAAMEGESLAVSTFGGLTIQYNGIPVVPAWKSQKARLMFCYLLTSYDTWVHRGWVIERLWPHRSPLEAEQNFKVTLNRLRSSFSAAALFDPVLTRGEAIRIDTAAVVLDVSRFRQLATGGITAHARGDSIGARVLLEDALQFYRGEFLPETAGDPFLDEARRAINDLHRFAVDLLERIYRTDGDLESLQALQVVLRGQLPIIGDRGYAMAV